VKKILAVLAAAVLVMSFAGAAFAIHAEIPIDTTAVYSTRSDQVMIGGEIRVRGRLSTGLDDGKPMGDWSDGNGHPNSYARWDQRVRLFVNAKVTPNIEAMVRLEAGTGGSDGWMWGNNGAYDKNYYGNRKPDQAMGIIEAWIQYTGSGLFGFPAGLKVGHMSLALGENQFLEHTLLGDDALVFFMDPNKQLHIGLITAKFDENNRGDNTDDVDAYIALMTYKIDDKNKMGANYTYLNHSDARTKLQNLGLHAKGSFGNFGYKGEVDFQFGDIVNDVRASGWGIMLAGNYKVNSVNLKASFASGSGDKNSTDKKNEEFQTFVNPTDHAILVYDGNSGLRTASTSHNSGNNQNTGIANTTYYNIGIDYTATKDLMFQGDLFFLRANNTSVWGSRVSKDIGWEFDGRMVYKLGKGLTYTIDGGILNTGSFYKDVYDGQKNVVLLRNFINLNF